MIGFYFRLFLVTIIRFIGMIGLLLWYQNFEVSPLPDWTLSVFMVVIQIFWTFLCTRWVLRENFPSRRLMIWLIVTFLLGEVALEIWMTGRLTGQTWLEAANGAIQWRSFYQIALQLGAIALGYWRTKTLRLREHAPDHLKI